MNNDMTKCSGNDTRVEEEVIRDARDAEWQEARADLADLADRLQAERVSA